MQIQVFVAHQQMAPRSALVHAFLHLVALFDSLLEFFGPLLLVCLVEARRLGCCGALGPAWCLDWFAQNVYDWEIVIQAFVFCGEWD